MQDEWGGSSAGRSGCGQVQAVGASRQRAQVGWQGVQAGRQRVPAGQVQVQAGSWRRQAVSSAGSQSRQGAREMPFYPSASNPRAASPRTLACGQAVFQHHHLFFSWLCHSAEWHPAQPSFVGSKEDRDSEGTGGAAEEELAPVWQGLLCCKTLFRNHQDFELGGPHTGMASLCLLSQDGAEMVGTGTSCPALHSGHLPVLLQHRASVSLHPVGTVPTTATPGKRGEVTR